MLKICIDVTALRPNPSGIGYYIASLIQALATLEKTENFQLIPYYQPAVKSWLRGDLSPPVRLKDYPKISCLPLPTNLTNLLSQFPNPILGYLESYLNYPDIVHGTDHIVYPCQKSLKVMTIHDLTFLKYPQYVPLIVKTYSARIQRCLGWTDLIITMAESTKADIISYLKVPAEKIRVIPLASRYQSVELKADFEFPHPYLLFVGTLEPRKNVTNLILAFDYLKKTYQIPEHLVLIGKKGWKYQEIFSTLATSEYQSSIHHLNYLPDELVAQYYQNARAFIYPSFYEGFGLPVLEAMTLGTPVITSNTSSLPEVVAEAAITVNPEDFREIAAGIYQVISQNSKQEELRQKGKIRAKQFSWQKTAQQTLAAYHSLL